MSDGQFMFRWNRFWGNKMRISFDFALKILQTPTEHRLTVPKLKTIQRRNINGTRQIYSISRANI